MLHKPWREFAKLRIRNEKISWSPGCVCVCVGGGGGVEYSIIYAL